MNFKRFCLTFLSVMISVTPCCSNAMKESSDCENSPLINSSPVKECVICLEPMEKGQKITNSGCNSKIPHEFHTECWEKWCESAPRDEIDKIACPMCKEQVIAPSCCTICGELLNNDEMIIVLSCNHGNHWSCTKKVYDFLKIKIGPQVSMPANYCFECNRVNHLRYGNVTKIGVHNLSEERLKDAAIKLHPELAEKLKQENTCDKKLLTLLALGTFASIISAWAMS